MFDLVSIVKIAATYESTPELDNRRVVVQDYQLLDETDSVEFGECVNFAADAVKRAVSKPIESSDHEETLFVAEDREYETDIYWQASKRWKTEMARWTMKDGDRVIASDDIPDHKRLSYNYAFFNDNVQLVFSSAAEEMALYRGLAV